MSAPTERPAQEVFRSDDAGNLYEPLGNGAAGAAPAARLDGGRRRSRPTASAAEVICR